MHKQVILCVDDEKTILDTLITELKTELGGSYIFEKAESVDEAWEVIAEMDVKKGCLMLVIADWLMPNIKGDEFLIELHHKAPQIAKMLLTGQADQDALERARKEADIVVFNKPWNRAELLSAVKRLLK